MANVRAQKPDEAAEVKAAAAAAVNVPQLRVTVEDLAAYNERVEARLEKLERRSR